MTAREIPFIVAPSMTATALFNYSMRLSVPDAAVSPRDRRMSWRAIKANQHGKQGGPN